jgi:hypothetical protein
MPSGTATTIDSAVDANTSGALTSSFCLSSSVTDAPFNEDVPKSPDRMPPIQSPYWTTSGRLRPSDSRNASIRSGGASVPPTTRARSPGSSRSSRNTTRLVTKKATTSSPKRRSRKSVIPLPSCTGAPSPTPILVHQPSMVIPEASNRDAVSFSG